MDNLVNTRRLVRTIYHFIFTKRADGQGYSDYTVAHCVDHVNDVSVMRTSRSREPGAGSASEYMCIIIEKWSKMC